MKNPTPPATWKHMMFPLRMMVIPILFSIVVFQVRATEKHPLFNPFNVLRFSMTTEHDDEACPCGNKGSHVFQKSIFWILTPETGENLGCIPEEMHSIDILRGQTTYFEFPLIPCPDYHPDIDISHDLSRYHLRLHLNYDRAIIPHLSRTSSGNTHVGIEQVPIYEYSPESPQPLMIPIDQIMGPGVTISLACEKLHISAQTACSMEIAETQEYIGYPYKTILSARYDCETSPYIYADNFIQWQYSHSGSEGFEDLPMGGEIIRIALNDIPGATFQDNILIGLKHTLSSQNPEFKTLRFYPQIPRPVSILNPIPPLGQETVDHLKLKFDRKLEAEWKEKIEVITIYDKIGSSPNGSLELSEARIVYQQKKDITTLSEDGTYTLYLPTIKQLKPGTYYLTVEGRALNHSTHPMKDNNSQLPEKVQTAMFPCMKFTIFPNTVNIKQVDYSPGLCFNDPGNVTVTLGKTYFPFEKLPEFYCIDNGTETKVNFQCISRGTQLSHESKFTFNGVNGNMRKFIVKDYSMGGSTGMEWVLSKQSYFEIETGNRREISVPIQKKDLSGTYYVDGKPFPSKDAHIVVDRKNVEHAVYPCTFEYAVENLNPLIRYPLLTDTIFCPDGGIFRVFVTDKNRCTSDTLITIGNKQQELKVAIRTLEGITCHGEDNGCLQAEIIKLSGDQIDIEWFKDDIPFEKDVTTLDALSSGTYRVEITDRRSGMKTTDQISLQDVEPLSIQTHNIGHVKCHGENTGYIHLSGHGGTPPYTYAWTDGFIGAQRSNLAEGEYTIELIDHNSCRIQQTYRIDGPSEPFRFKIDSIYPVHFDTQGNLIQGKVMISSTGGTPPYGAPICCLGHDMNALEPGLHQLMQIDYLGCVHSQTFTVPLHDSLSIYLTQEKEILCHGEHTAACRVHIQGGVPPYEIQWNNGATHEYISGLEPGQYRVKVTDHVGVEKEGSIHISQPELFRMDSTWSKPPSYPVYENGNLTMTSPDGEIKIFPAGGTPPYKFQWMAQGSLIQPQDPCHLQKLTSGIYTVLITDSKGCDLQQTFYFQDIKPLKADIEILKSIPCYGMEEGLLLGRVTGGTAPYRFSWKRDSSLLEGIYLGKDSSCIENLKAGTYSLEVTDAMNISSSNILQLQQPPRLDIETTFHQAPSYSGCIDGEEPPYLDNGRIHLNISGGTPPYQITIGEGALEKDTLLLESGTLELKHLKAGNYPISVNDSKGCTDTQINVTLEQLPHLGVFLSITDTVSCFRSSNGKIEARVSGGQPPYQVDWFFNGEPHGSTSLPQQGNTRIEELSSGNYAIQVTDANGIISSNRIFLPQPDSLSIILKPTPPSCHGDSSGMVEAQVSGGKQPYSYQWTLNGKILTSDGDMSQSWIGNLEDGRISLSVQDRNHCQAQGHISIQAPDSLTISVSLQHPSYSGSQWKKTPADTSDGKISMKVSGGTPPYRISVYHNDIQLSSVPPTAPGKPLPGNTDSICLPNLPEGIYRIKITDSMGCHIEKQFELIRPPHLETHLSIVQEPLCQGSNTGILHLAKKGGTPPYTVNWFRNHTWIKEDSNSQTFLWEEGNYIAETRDAKGVISFDSIYLGEPDSLEASIQVCHASAWTLGNGSAEISIQGGTPPYSGSLTFIDKDFPNSQNTMPSGMQMASNQDSTASLKWKHLARGKYRIHIQDTNGCYLEKDFHINSPDSLLIDNIKVSHIDTWHPSGSLRFTIKGGLPPFHIEVIYKDTILKNKASQQNDTLLRQVKPSREFVMEGLAEGFYQITLTDSGGANAYLETDICFIHQIETQTWIKSPISCPEQCNAIAYTDFQGGMPPYTLEWQIYDEEEKLFRTLQQKLYSSTDESEGTGSNRNQATRRDNLCQGIYRFCVSDTLGHLSCDTITIHPPVPIQATFTFESSRVNVHPEGGTPPYSFLWNTGSTTSQIDVTRDSSYSLTISDSYGCYSEIELDTSVSRAMELNIHPIRTLDCHGQDSGIVELIIHWGKPPFSIRWYRNGVLVDSTIHRNGAIRLEHLDNADYMVSVTDSLHTQRILEWEMEQPKPLKNHFNIKNVNCHGMDDGQIEISTSGGSFGYTYLWDDLSTSPTRNHLKAGTYHVRTSDGKGCTRNDTILVSEPSMLKPFIRIDQPICYNSQGYISSHPQGGTPPYTYRWGYHMIDHEGTDMQDEVIPLQQDSILGYVEEGTYKLHLSDNLGCCFDTSILIIRPDSLQYDLKRRQFLCLGQDLTLRAEVKEENQDIRHQWFLPDGNTLEAESVSTNQPGIYQLLIIENELCLYRDSVNVIALTDSIHSEFWVPSWVKPFQHCLLVNLSRHQPDSIAWEIPSEAIPIASYGNAIEIVFHEEGVFEVGSISYKGLCQEKSSKNIMVALPKTGVQDTSRDDFPQIRIEPNPTSGRCILNITTGGSTSPHRDLDMEYWLITSPMGKIVKKGRFSLKTDQDFQWEILNGDEAPGMYILLLRNGVNKRSFKIIKI